METNDEFRECTIDDVRKLAGHGFHPGAVHVLEKALAIQRAGGIAQIRWFPATDHFTVEEKSG
jgi:hypothetical protein